MIRNTVSLLLFLGLVFLGCTKKSGTAENEINFPLTINLNSMDSVQASNAAATMVLGNLYEGLMEFHYLKRPLVVQPLLAAAMPEVSKDGLVHKFKIKPGVKFHDSEAFPNGKGLELVAQDFIYSWKRLADPKTKTEGWWIFDGKIKGFNEWREKLIKGEANYDTPIEGLQAPDNSTLIITLTKPYYQLHYVLTMPYAGVVPREAVEKYGAEFMNHPVGTGPYKFESWVRGNKVVLVKNPTWHGGTYPTEGEPSDKEKGNLADAGKALPFVDKLNFFEVPEDQPRWLNVMKGNYDWTAIPKDNFDSAVQNRTELKPEYVAKGFKLFIRTSPDVAYTGFNMEDPVVGKNANLRKALALAYNQEISNKKFYNDRVVTAHSPIAPDMDGWDPNFKNPYKEHNISKAKEFLAKAGYPEGKGLPAIEYSFPTSTTGRQIAEYGAQQFAQIGVKLKLVGHSWPQFQERLRTKKSQTFGLSWIADYPDAENMLQLFYSKNKSPGPNNTNYSNPEFDKLYEASLKLPPGPERTKLYLQMRDIFVEDMPWIPTVHRLGYTIANGWVNNLKYHDIIHGFHKYIRIDTVKKAELKAKL